MSEKRRLFHLGLWGPRVEEGVDWEIEHHLQERIDELIALGRSRKEAEEEAHRTFGDLPRVRRELRKIDRQQERRMRFQDVLETVWQDVRYGLRGLVRDSTFTLSLILTMGLGIGANVGMFSVLDALLLRPMPYDRPEELYQLYSIHQKDNFGQPYFSWDFAQTLLASSKAFDQLMVHERPTALYTGGAEAKRLAGAAVTANFEETLGVRPVLGRGFLPDDMRPGGERVVLIDNGFWRSALGGAQSVVGSTIELDGMKHTVIGVMPPGFKFPEYSTTEFWVPIATDGSVLGEKLTMVHLLARMPAPGFIAASARATADARSVYQSIKSDDQRTIRIESMNESRARGRNLRQSVWLLAGAVWLILLVAGVNVVNLLLVRGIVRSREIAVRLAIGATRARLVRQLTTETLTITMVSALVALLFAFAAVRGMQTIMPDTITFFAPYAIAIERRAVVFTFLLTLACGIVFGTVPALLATRRNRKDSAADLTRYAARTPSRARLRRSLIAVEVALSVVLLVGAGLLIRSFLKLQAVDPGFRPDHLAVLRFELSPIVHPNAQARADYLRRLTDAVERVPGVAATTVSNGMAPHTNIMFGLALQAEGEAPHTQGNPVILPYASVQPDFFEVTGARLLAGRTFTEADSSDTVIIDEDLAAFLWPGQNPVGRRFRTDAESDWLTVAGVMADIKLMGPDDREGDFEMVRSLGRRAPGGYVTVAIRTRSDTESVLPAVREVVRTIDRRQPIGELSPADAFYAESIAMPRFLLVLVTVLAALALLLAVVGIYGVLAFGVQQRAHEIGVRTALGARSADLVRMVVQEGFTVAVIGALFGLAGAVALSRFIRALLFDIEPLDPATLAVVIATILASAIAAALLPARRAVRVSPVSVLRNE